MHPMHLTESATVYRLHVSAKSFIFDADLCNQNTLTTYNIVPYANT